MPEGHVISEQNPSGTETFGYDSNSNLIKQVDFKGQERDFVFDDLNRETAEKWMSGGSAINTITTAYNPMARSPPPATITPITPSGTTAGIGKREKSNY